MDDILKPAEIKPKSSSNEQFAIPFDIVPLPSRGKLYKTGPLAGQDMIEVHYLTAIEEDILTSPNLLQSGKMLDTLIKSVVKNKTIEPEKLLLGDRNAIMVWLRSTGYGAEYPVKIGCNQCSNEFIKEFDLGSLEVKYLEEEPDSDGHFSFTLPVSRKTITFKLLTSEDELTIIRKVESMQKKMGTPINNTNTLKLMTSVVAVDGNSDPVAIKKFVETMPIKDSKAFREFVNEFEPGIIMKQECVCPQCGNTSQEVIPIRSNFFWPDSGE